MAVATALDFLETKKLTRSVAEPNVLTLSGEQATIAEIMLMARLNGLGGHWKGMLELALKAVEADPKMGAARSLVAEARLKANGDQKGAMRAMSRAVVVDPRRATNRCSARSANLVNAVRALAAAVRKR